MIGCAGKSGRYLYYGCGTALKQGKRACGAKQISRQVLEEFVIDRLKVGILTDENLRELVRLTNEELEEENAAQEEQLLTLDAQLEDLRERLKKLFLAVETGKFEEDDLAPRIRELKGQIEELASVRSQLSQTLNLPVDPVDEALIGPLREGPEKRSRQGQHRRAEVISSVFRQESGGEDSGDRHRIHDPPRKSR
jgi:DNA repair exonuclease SbcCD ATPase subunit